MALLSEARGALGMTPAAFGGGVGSDVTSGSLRVGVAGSWSCLSPPTRGFVSAPFPVTKLSHLRGNLELLIKG